MARERRPERNVPPDTCDLGRTAVDGASFRIANPDGATLSGLFVTTGSVHCRDTGAAKTVLATIPVEDGTAVH